MNKLPPGFAALARKAYAIMLETGWTANPDPKGFWVDATYDGADDEDNYHPDELQKWLHGRYWPCPFQAIVETRAWWIANVQGSEVAS